MNAENLPSKRISVERVRLGIVTSCFGLLMMTLGAKPEFFSLDRSPVVGFVQIIVFLIGLAIICLGGYIGLAALWGQEEKSISADIGIRLVSTGFVIALFSGMADVFGMTVQQSDKLPFFGPWQAAGMELGVAIIAVGILMMIPYQQFGKIK